MRFSVLSCFLAILLPQASAKVGGRNGGGRLFSKGSFHGKSYNHVNARHAHFSYHPPQHINYVCRHCTAPISYPVYHAPLPTYVYKYRESGSPLGLLLTGLALYNLGRASSEHTPYDHYYHTQSKSEECSMQVIENSLVEETRIPCFMISTFLARASNEPSKPQPNQLDITSSQIDVHDYINATGPPITVTTNQECVIWHNTSMVKESRNVRCDLLKKYAETLKPSGLPVYVWLPAICGTVLVISLCCHLCCKKKRKDEVDDASISETTILGYTSYYH